MATYRLEDWSVRKPPYTAPEQGVCLVGTRDGERVMTSFIDHVDGRRVTTRTGSVYVLGEPDPSYLVWLERHGIEYSPEQPIRVVEAQATEFIEWKR